MPRSASVSEVLRTLISMYKELFKAALSDVLFFQNYPQIMLVVDEVCKEVSNENGGSGGNVPNLCLD